MNPLAHYTVPCDHCGAHPHRRCRNMNTGVEINTAHMVRLRAQYPRCGRCGLELTNGRCQIVGCGA